MLLSPVSLDSQLSDQNILNYCTSGDLKSLQRCSNALLRVIHKPFPDGQTCLIAACRNGNRDVVEYLIDTCGADVEQVGVVEFESEQVEGVPPLWCAAASGHMSVVEALVVRGADVNRTTITNSTALRAACFDGHEQVVRYLVQHGANVEIPNRHGHTCLMISCYRQHDRVVEFLVNSNARVNRRSAKGNTALHDCAESGNLHGLKLLLEHGAVVRPDEYGQSPIMSGANAAYRKIVEHLASLTTENCSSPSSIHEKIAAYELLGASLFDRHSLIQDALSAWFESLNLRRQAGTYPKRFSPPHLIPCHVPHPVPMETGDHSPPPSNQCATFPSPTSSSTTTPTISNWSLVHLAAREAIYLADRAAHPRDYALCRIPVRSRVVRDDTRFRGGFHSRRQRMHADLYRAYEREVRLDGIPSPKFTESSMGVKSRQTGLYQTGVEFLSPNCNFHPAIGLVHPASPADPVRGFGVQCWERPRFRRWPLNPTAGQTATSRCCGGGAAFDPSDTLAPMYCDACKRRLVCFGSWALVDPLHMQCSSCSTRSNSVPPVNTIFAGPVPQPNVNHTGTGHFTDLPCLCSRLTTDDHPLIRRLRQFGEEAFGPVVEFANEEELTDLTRNAHALRLQPLLIRLRLLGPDHLDTIYFIRYRGAIYADTDNFRRCLNLWRYALELQRIFLEPLCQVSQAAFVSFAELFQFVLSNHYAGLSATELDPALIVDCLELAVDSVERGMDYSFYHWYRRFPWSYSTADKEAINLMRHVALCLQFIAMLVAHYVPEPNALPGRADFRSLSGNADRPPTSVSLAGRRGSQVLGVMSNALRERFYYQTYRLVRLDPRVHDGQSLVHLACSVETSSVGRSVICRFPDLTVLRLLFQLGADPNCADLHGQRPLLSVLSQRRLQPSEQAVLVTTLVEHGAHLDAANHNGLSILDHRFRHIQSQTGIRVLDHVTLKCCAARVVHRVGYNKRNAPVFLPDSLWTFVEMH